MMNIKLLILLLILLMPISCSDSIDLDPTLVWQDPTYQLIWQKAPEKTSATWEEANNYCEELVLNDFTDWRLPSIDELRTLIRGCPWSASGAKTCKVSDQNKDYDGENCLGCFVEGVGECHYCGPEPGEGPGKNGCFWPSEFEGECSVHYSNTEATYKNKTYKWSITFRSGYIQGLYIDDIYYLKYVSVRCVRGNLDRSQIVEHTPQVDCKPGQGCE